MRPDRRWVVAVLLAVAAPAAHAGSVVEGIMARMAALPARTAGFVEEKRLASLTVPLESRGRLAFTPPARLEKDTLAPRPERLVIDGDQLTIATPGAAERRIGLDEHPALRLLADTLRAVLGGDLPTLRRLYAIEEQGTEAAWRLLMLPREPAARRALARVTVDGARTDIRQIVLQQANGDTQRLSIQP